MSRKIIYPITKTCPVCNSLFETGGGLKYEKTFCSLRCSNQSRKVDNKTEKQNAKRRKEYSLLSEEEKEKKRNICRSYAKKHRSELNEWAREYRKNNSELIKSEKRKARREMKFSNPERMIWLETKKRAKKRGILFDIEVSDIVIPKKCPILGIELIFGVGRCHGASPSLDRIIPEKGYVKGNCFIISLSANRKKQDNSLEDFEKIISYIKERLP